MNKYVSILLIAALSGLSVYGQVTITSDDMPQAYDTLRVSMTNLVPGDFTQTGNDTTWDFSGMIPVSQRVETFIPVTSVPQEYWLVFIPSIICNLAAPADLNLPIPGFPVTDSYSFYNNISSGFYDAGSAFKVNNIPVALKYDVPDLWYPFPLMPGTTWNSASFSFLSIPSIAYISNQRTRSGVVDGWGTLITPYGTFSTIRVKSVLEQKDSIHMESMGLNMSFPRRITQYKWLAPGEGIPVLQVNVELNMVSAIYRDTIRPATSSLNVDIGPDTAVLKGNPITLTAVVTNGVPPYHYVWSTFDTTQSITLVIDSTLHPAVVVFDGLNNLALDQVTITVKYPPGIRENQSGHLLIAPNPSDGKVTVTLPSPANCCRILVRDLSGREMIRKAYTGMTARLVLDLKELAKGSYIVVVETPMGTHTGTLILE